MTTEELLEYYADLLILQYRGQPKAYATIEALVKPVVMDQLPTQVQDAFDPLTAVGAQLDILGKYQGVTRTVNTVTGFITLDDDDFRALFQFAITRNNSNGTLYAIDQLLFTAFGMNVLVFDYQNMRISYMVASSVGTANLFLVLLALGLLPRPMGVQQAAIIIYPTLSLFFGMGTYAIPAWNVEPFNRYESVQTTWKFLEYFDAVSVLYDLTTEAGDHLVQEDGGLLYV